MDKKKARLNRGGLSASQQDAIRMLVSGCTAKYTALVLKLNYADVRKWISNDIQFQSELAAQEKKQQTHASEIAAPSQEKKITDEKSRRGSYEGDELPTELASP